MLNTQVSSGQGKLNDASRPGAKRGFTDQSLQMPNKAARLEPTTNGSSHKLNNQVERDGQLLNATEKQRLPPVHKVLTGLPATHQNTLQEQTTFAPATPNDCVVQPSGYSRTPSFLTTLGPTMAHSSFQEPRVQSVHHEAVFGPLQSGPHQSTSYADVPFTRHADYNQTSDYANVTHTSSSVHQGRIPVGLEHNPEPPSDRPPLLPPLLHHPDSLSCISGAVASLSNTKALEILATAAMRHREVYLEVQVAVAKQATSEAVKHSTLFEHLVAQERFDAENNLFRDNVTIAAPAAYPTQSTQVGLSADEMVNRPVTEILDFSDNVRRVDYLLNTRYAGLRDSQQAHITMEASCKIEDQIQDISNQVQTDSSYGTKRNAMVELCEIGMMVIEADGYLGSKIKDHMSYKSVFVEEMQKLYESMNEAERRAISRDLMEDLEQLDKDRDICFEGFDEIVEQFRRADPQR